jgi:Mn-dependent DtxR family transcriptional regulator
MPSKYERTIYQMLSNEPVTPNEVAIKLGIAHKTALKALMRLALTEKDVRYKNSGRIHLFWKRNRAEEAMS